MDSDLSIHIDLYNLEDVKFEGSKYVLTSPRSLEACSRLDVKPIELLYRPLSEFQEELLPQDIPLRTIYSLYDESEQIRQKKLKLCREERSRIIQADDKKTSILKTFGKLSTLPSEDVAKGSQRKKGTKISSTTAVGYRKDIRSKSLQRMGERESCKLHRELVSKKEKNPRRSRSATRACPPSADRKRPNRCASSVTVGAKVKYRSGSLPSRGMKIPARDEKILKLMKDRREVERKKLEESEQVHRLWEDQKQREQALRIIAENKRRHLLAEENRIRDLRKMEEKERYLQLEERERDIRALAIKNSEVNSEISLMNQLRMQELSLSDKMRKEIAKKEMQEKNKRMKETEDEDLKKLLVAKQVCDIQSASERRDVRLHQESLKKFLDNRQEREAHEQRQNMLKSQAKQNKALVRSSMEGRLKQAESNLALVLEQRNQQLEEKSREEQAKLQRARSTQRRLEAEMEAWRQGLLQHKKMLEDKASEVVSRGMDLKSWKVKKDRTSRQLEQQKNVSKIHKEVEKWRRDLERSLVERERKLEDMEDERERQIAETRALAQLTQTLRDDIKERYVSDTFDKKVLEAQLYASLDNSTKSPSLKNKSSIKIC